MATKTSKRSTVNGEFIYLIFILSVISSVMISCSSEIAECFNSNNMEVCNKLCHKGNAGACAKVCFSDNDVDACEMGCQGGEKSACIKLKQLSGKPLNKKDAADNKKTNPPDTKSKPDKKALQKAELEKLKVMENECLKGNAQYCLMVGDIYKAGKMAKKDMSKATEYYSQACDKKIYSGCRELGNALIEGDGVERNPEKGIKLLDIACDNDIFSACGVLGLNYYAGLNIKKDQKKAVEYLTRACNANYFESCLPLARHLYNLKTKRSASVSKKRKIIGYLQNACTGNVAEGCLALGQAYSMGKLVRKKHTRAQFFFTRACDLGSKKGCEEKKKYRNDGFYGLIQKNDLKTVEKSCKEGDAKACTVIGDTFASGLFFKTDEKKARTFLNEGCKNGDENACSILKNYRKIYKSQKNKTFILRKK
ncbi:MAG: sel1 repeat family protein [Deltaproteobacteria bacterium]|nr:sel1 repeat family protein [Deltaproteobacteria bacterium]